MKYPEKNKQKEYQVVRVNVAELALCSVSIMEVAVSNFLTMNDGKPRSEVLVQWPMLRKTAKHTPVTLYSFDSRTIVDQLPLRFAVQHGAQRQGYPQIPGKFRDGAGAEEFE